MTSRERVIAAIEFKRHDRVPVDLWTVPAALLRHGDSVEELMRKHPIDFHYPMWLTRWDESKVDPTFRTGRYTDDWGVIWENVNDGWQGQVSVHPLDDWSRLDTYRAPEPMISNGFSRDPEKFGLLGGCHFFHRVCFLRSMQNVMMDIADDDPRVYTLRDMVWDYYRKMVEMQARQDTDGIVFFDDFGSQTGLLISPGLWRQFIGPVYKDLFEICSNAGKYVFFHSDGYILEIIDDLIELGVDALNCQVWCMGPKLLGERFRGRVAFWGEINRQTTLPCGSPGDIRSAAKEMIRHLATPDGGLIGQSEIDGLTPVENIEAVLTAWY